MTEHTEPTKKKMPLLKKIRILALGLIGFFFLLVLIGILASDPDSIPEPPPIEGDMTLQQRLERNRYRFYRNYKKARNEIAADAVFNEANNWTVQFAKDNGYLFENWVGKIGSISNFEVHVGVSISSKSNGIEIEYHDLSIAPDSGVYSALRSVGEGDTVHFSGMLVRSEEKGIQEASFTKSGSLENPEFYVELLRLGRSSQSSLTDAEKQDIASQVAASLDAEEELTAQVESAGEKPMQSEWDASVYEVEKYLKKTLLAPDSFDAIAWSPVTFLKGHWVVRCKYRAKNALGGYAIAHQLFFIKFGEVASVQVLD